MNYFNTLLFAVGFLLSFQALHAQQLPLFSQYTAQPGLLNPAAVSTDHLLYNFRMNVGGAYRLQSIGDNTVGTAYLSGNYRYQPAEAVGLLTGVQIVNDQNGPTGQTGFYGRVAGIVGNPEQAAFALGFNFGYVQHRLDATEITFVDAGDILADRRYTRGVGDLGIGLFTYSYLGDQRDILYAGLSAPQILETDLTFTDLGDQFVNARARHFYGTVGYVKQLGQGALLETSAWAKKTVGAPTNLDLNLRYQFISPFWVGLGGSTAGVVHFEAGLFAGQPLAPDENTVRIGYSFDYFFGPENSLFQPSHELNANWYFK